MKRRRRLPVRQAIERHLRDLEMFANPPREQAAIPERDSARLTIKAAEASSGSSSPFGWLL